MDLPSLRLADGHKMTPASEVSGRSFVAPIPDQAVEPGGTPDFSVIIAAYQAANSIGEAVDSALEQTVAPREIVVCDDGSTDDLDAALAPYRDRITVVRQPNRGEAAAKNAAARVASAEFIAILDADDVYLPERIQALGQLAAARPDLDILTTDAFLEVGGRQVRRCYGDAFPFVVDDQRAGILERNFIFGLAAVRRRRLLDGGGFDESIRTTTDWECWIRLILDGARAGLVSEPLARYRLRPESLSASRVGLLRGRVATLEKAVAHPGLRPEERRAVGRSLADQRRQLRLLEAQAALAGRQSDARRRALEIARDAGYGRPTRYKASVAAAAPGLVGRWLANGDRWIRRSAGGFRDAGSH
jgi:Glycosyl transferase family 2